MSTIIRAKVSKPHPKGRLEPIEESVIVMDCKTPSFKIVVRTDSGFTDSNEKVIVISDINQKEQKQLGSTTNNNVFIGSTADLQRLLNNDEDNIIDVTPDSS